jgi:hypothetical protein
MSRQTFFSFHFQRDIFRVNTVRNSHAFANVDDKGIFDHSLWEKTRLSGGDPALRRLIDGGLRGASVTVVLIGLETYGRRWVKYEIEESAKGGMGLLGIDITKIRNLTGETDPTGRNPFVHLGIADHDGRPVRIHAWNRDDGYHNMAAWVEEAARRAGR